VARRHWPSPVSYVMYPLVVSARGGE
jgi:hypothetical protein